MAIDETQINLEANTVNANTVKNTVIRKLFDDNVITESQFMDLYDNYHIVIIKNGWFKNWCKRFNHDESAWTYKFIKFDQ